MRNEFHFLKNNLFYLQNLESVLSILFGIKRLTNDKADKFNFYVVFTTIS